MIDLDAIKKRHLDPERNRGRTYYEGHIEVDLAMLVEEVEWLRSLRHIDNEQLARAWDESRDMERAAVVAWLEKAGFMPSMVEVFRRGEHRREEVA